MSVAAKCAARINKKYVFAVCCFSVVLLFCLVANGRNDDPVFYLPNFGQQSTTFADDRWSYQCRNERCTRVPSNTTEKTSLETCNMICSTPQLWPQPSKLLRTGKSTANFLSKQIYLQTLAEPSVQEYLEQAYIIFHENIYRLLLDETEGETKPSPIKLVINVRVAMPSLELTLETDESYTVLIGRYRDDVVANITAHTYYGARHGLETLSQLIWWDRSEKTLKVLSEVEVKDAPKFPYRGVMVDTARNYFTLESLSKIVTGMAANKLNVFHWHITDTQSFPLKSKRTEKFAHYGAYTPNQVYTSADIAKFVAFSKLRGVRVILEVDAPAHVSRGWEWGVSEGLGPLIVCEKENIMEGQLNAENPEVLNLLEGIYRDVFELNTNREVFHLGSDEVDENCWRKSFSIGDTRAYWGGFVQKMLKRLQNANSNTLPKHIVMWSSPLTQPPHLQKYLNNSNVVIQSWLGEIGPLVSAGYKLIFSTVGHWYLDCGFGHWRESSRAVCDPYTPWQTFYKYTPWLENNCERQTLGGEVCLWSEQVGQDSLETRFWPRSAAFAERVWSDPKSEYTLHESVYTRLDTQRRRMVGRGLRAEGMWPQICSQNPGKCN